MARSEKRRVLGGGHGRLARVERGLSMRVLVPKRAGRPFPLFSSSKGRMPMPR